MNRKGKEPKLLTTVLHVIANSKEDDGPTTNQIIQNVYQTIEPTKVPKIFVMQVYAALRYVIDAGIAQRRRGRYRSNMNRNDVRKMAKAFDKNQRRAFAPQRKQVARKFSDRRSRNYSRRSNSTSSCQSSGSASRDESSVYSSAGASSRSTAKKDQSRQGSLSRTTGGKRKRWPTERKEKQRKDKQPRRKDDDESQESSSSKCEDNPAARVVARRRSRKLKPSDQEPMSVDDRPVADVVLESNNSDYPLNVKQEPDDDGNA